jgi:hypothetical protein
MLRRDFVQQVADRFGPKGAPVLRFRIGIHRGRAVVGNVGYQSKHRRLGSRFEYDCMGEAANIAVIASVLCANPQYSGITITRDVLVEETASGHDVLCATDLVAFAVRETSIFCHDAFPRRTYTALQLVGVCDSASGGLDLVRETTRRFVVPLDEDIARSQTGGTLKRTGGGGPVKLVALSKQFRSKCYDLSRARTAWQERRDSSDSSSETDTESEPAAARSVAETMSWSDSDTDSSLTFSSSSLSSSAPLAALLPSAAAASDEGNEPVLHHLGGAGGGKRSGRARNSMFLAPRDAVSAPSQRSFFVDERKEPIPRARGLSREQWELAQRTRAVAEQQRAMIASSAKILRQHFFVDEPACDCLHAMSAAQRMFSRGSVESLKAAARLCREALLKPILAAEKASSLLSRQRSPHQLLQHLSPDSCAETKQVLLESRLNRQGLVRFISCCVSGVKNPNRAVGSVIVVNVDQKAEF